jgi:hypothetical protein
LRVGDRDTQIDAPGLSYAAKCYAADQTGVIEVRHNLPGCHMQPIRLRGAIEVCHNIPRLSYAADQTAGRHRSPSQLGRSGCLFFVPSEYKSMVVRFTDEIPPHFFVLELLISHVF